MSMSTHIVGIITATDEYTRMRAVERRGPHHSASCRRSPVPASRGRREVELTAQALADLTTDLHTPVTRNTIAKLESGRLRLSVDQADSIAAALKLPIVELLSADAVVAAARQQAAALREEADRIELEAGIVSPEGGVR